MPKTYEGGCLCGAVRYSVCAEPVNERVCHCRLCQRSIGAAFNARLLFRIEDVKRHGPLGVFHSSPELAREFCQNCGTTLFTARAGSGVIGVTAGSLDDPSLFQPTMHTWTSSRQPWVRLDDGLPQHEAGVPN